MTSFLAADRDPVLDGPHGSCLFSNGRACALQRPAHGAYVRLAVLRLCAGVQLWGLPLSAGRPTGWMAVNIVPLPSSSGGVIDSDRARMCQLDPFHFIKHPVLLGHDFCTAPSGHLLLNKFM